MVIDDFNVVRAVGFPHKTHTPLVIDTDAVLSAPITGTRFEPIARWHSHRVERCCAIELLQFSCGNARNIGKSFDALTRENARCVFALKRFDHAFILYRLPVNAIRNL